MTDLEYSIAITEVFEILKHFSESDLNKLPVKFVEFLYINRLETYTSKIDFSKPLYESNLRPQTLILLGIIYRTYWCNEDEKREFDEILEYNTNIKKTKKLEEKIKKELFENPDKKEIKKTLETEVIKTLQNEEVPKERSLTVKKESLITKIIKAIKSIFKKG